MKCFALLLALAGSASAFMPASAGRMATALSSKYENQVWDINAKKDIYESWNPSSPRTEDNFNPFEKDDSGNSCDTNGYFPGEGKYKDPMRPDTSYAIMQAEQAVYAEIAAAPPKPGQPGPGNYQGFNVM
eukprot:CAMPEP_0172652188 /NCGR_PEP_ID=MMETSP1068-20121228/243189_1 /TAXON_ID=35684 /ORGANISM="Pseudopedinella elastica, Strain CCMP716" /LENGTH=129 /DNA_ID=CAMNT_0013466595 /DNA_START=527 /DNA_END=916 /DNA_ORIENTATION=-